MIDFHSHILPEIDDGSSSVEESLAMLSMLKSQGVDCVVATPHFTGNMLVDEFMEMRNFSYLKLKNAIDSLNKDFPRILLGAEVLITDDVIEKDSIEKLSIANTNCVMFEMPAKSWNNLHYQILYSLSAKYRIRLMIAHIDRYFSLFENNERVLKLAKMQPIFQINTSALNSYRCKRLLRLMNKLDANIVFGSDCHNTSYRMPNYGEPLKLISKNFGKEYLEKINSFGEKLLNNEQL